MTDFHGKYYSLNDKHEVIECSRTWWSNEYEDFEKNRRVAKTDIKEGVSVSTVFLGMDHGFGQHDKPIVFETLVFGGKLDEEMCRYSTWEEAVKGHQLMVKACMEAENISVEANHEPPLERQ
jgi:hypothetical protein